MSKKGFIVFFVFILFSVIFFNKSFFKGQIPFPGDLLITNYSPYNAYSYLGYAPGSFPHKAQNIDVVEQLYPWKFFSIDLLKKGEIPLWNPYNFSGTPHLAAIQSGTFYPINILFFIMPFNLAWTIFIILQPVLAGIFTYLFLKELKLGDKSAIYGGLIFSFSAFLVVWMQYGNIIHAILWLPIVMWLGLRNLRDPSIIKSILLSFLLSFSIFAGHFQVSIYLYGFSFAFLLFAILVVHKKNIFKNLLVLIGIYSFSLSISAIQLLPSIEIFINSSRSNYAYERLVEFLIPTYHLVGILFPDFFGNPVSRNYFLTGTYIERASYIGILPIFFVIFTLFVKKNRYIWFFLLSAVAVFFITYDSLITKFLYSIYIPPVIATSVPTRIMFVMAFSLSVVAAFGFESFKKNKNKSIFLKSLGIIGLIILSIWAFVYLSPDLFGAINIENLLISKRNMIIPTLVLVTGLGTTLVYTYRDKFFLKKYSLYISRLFFILIFLITIFDLYFFFQKFSPFVPSDFIYPQNSALQYVKENQNNYRTWGYGSANFRANVQTYEQIYSTDGYDPFYIRRYGELMASTDNGKVPENIMRANAHLVHGFGEGDLTENMYRQKIMNLLGVKYILHKKDSDNHAFDKTFDVATYDLAWYGNSLQIYENKEVLPRAFIVNDYEVIQDENEIIKRLYENDFDISKKIILEKEPVIKVNGGEDNSKIDIRKYSENEIIIDVKVADNSLLFLSDSYFPEWNAYIDGDKAEILRADYAFRAVGVPSGEHEIIFRYEPRSFEIGKTISLISIISAFFIIIVVRFRNKK